MPKMNPGSQIKVLTVVGARPNFMKAAPIIRAIADHNKRGARPAIQHLLVHTGQHYDPFMSDKFFADLNLPEPDVHLGVGSASQACQTAEILRKFESVLMQEHPDVAIVVGDVNSTVACALAAAKLPVAAGGHRPLIAHVEAGLRSFDRAMPEEINRILTDQLADLLFVTEKSALVNLRREGIARKKMFFVGNTMIDSLLAFKGHADESRILDDLALRTGVSHNGNRGSIRPYALLTLHRPSNVDDAGSFRGILDGLCDLGGKLPVIFPVHPRTRKRVAEFGMERYFQTSASQNGSAIRMVDPLGYVDFLCLMKNARLVLTDSGGIQEETTCLAVPCVTIRENTERPITVKHGTNVIAGTAAKGIRKAIGRQLSRTTRHVSPPDKWDGKAANRIVQVLARTVYKRTFASPNKPDPRD